MKLLLFVLLFTIYVNTEAKEKECEVCVKVIDRLSNALSDTERKSHDEVVKKFKEICLNAKNDKSIDSQREAKFCYYVGGASDSATSVLKQLSSKIQNFLPALKICKVLSKNDNQVCELKYDKQIDWKNVNLKKMRVKELKKILSGWNENCVGCVEKQDFIDKIEKLKPKYVREEL